MHRVTTRTHFEGEAKKTLAVTPTGTIPDRHIFKRISNTFFTQCRRCYLKLIWLLYLFHRCTPIFPFIFIRPIRWPNLYVQQYYHQWPVCNDHKYERSHWCLLRSTYPDVSRRRQNKFSLMPRPRSIDSKTPPYHVHDALILCKTYIITLSV